MCFNFARLVQHRGILLLPQQWRGSRSTYFSNVMMSLWPLYCHASRRARSLASELRFKRGKGYSELLSHHKIHSRGPLISLRRQTQFRVFLTDHKMGTGDDVRKQEFKTYSLESLNHETYLNRNSKGAVGIGPSAENEPVLFSYNCELFCGNLWFKRRNLPLAH